MACLSGACAWLRGFGQHLTLSEISGALGDLGTFLPLIVALVKTNGLDLGTTLIFTGAYNIITGISFGIPMPVQPMKLIVAVALSGTPLSIPEIMAAGMFVSVAVLVLGAARMMGLAQSLIPMPVIRGMQLGVGLQLGKKGFQQVWFANSKSAPARGWWGVEGLFLGIFALLFVLLTVYTRQDSPPRASQRRHQLLPTSTAEPATAGQQAHGPGPAAAAAAAVAVAVDEYEADKDIDLLPAAEVTVEGAAAEPAAWDAGQQSRGAAVRLSPAAARSSAYSNSLGPSQLDREHFHSELRLPAMPPSAPVTPSPSLGSDSCSDGNEDPSICLLEATGAGAAGMAGTAATAAGGASYSRQRWRRREEGRCAAARRRLQTWLHRLQAQLEASLEGGPSAQEDKPPRGAGSGCGSSLACRQERRGFRVPVALALVVLGVVMTLVTNPDILAALRFGPSMPQVVVPTGDQWHTGIIRAGLPQLALTTFNSVISVCQLSRDLFPDRPASPDAVAASVGAMNLVGGWFGAMPCCHGAGGLAAQARFGATTGTAPIFLGLVKLALGLLFGSSLFQLLQSFPQPLMGAMLVYAGVQLAACGRGQRGERGLAVMLLTSVVTLAMSNVAVGVIVGIIAAYSLLAADLLQNCYVSRAALGSESLWRRRWRLQGLAGGAVEGAPLSWRQFVLPLQNSVAWSAGVSQPSMTRLSISAAAPPWRLACWRGSGQTALQHVSWSRWPTALRPVRHGPRAAAGSINNSSGQLGGEAEGQQAAIISSQPNDLEQRQLWQQAYNQVLAFQQAHGRLPRTNATKVGPLLEGEGRLGRWCVLQQRRRDGSKGQQLSAEERAALQAIAGWEWDRARPTRRDWWQRLREVEAFVVQHGRLPRTSTGESSPFLPGEQQLGNWCDYQRQRYKGQRGKPLKTGEEAALTAIPDWFWEQWQQQDWEPQYQSVVAFQLQHGRLPRREGSSSQPLVEDEGQLGNWCHRQRQCYKRQKQPALAPEQAAALAAIPGWYWEQHQDWEPRYQQVVAFQQQHGRLPRQTGSRSQPLVEDERQLGLWCQRQRQCYKGQRQSALEPEQQAALEAVPGWYWGQHDYWEQQYQQMVAFQQQHGRLPRREGSRSQPLVENERQLWMWCQRQRQCYKGQQQPALEPAWEAALEAVPGWYWERYKKEP